MNDNPTNISTPPLVVGFVSLGCPKNLVDSERMLASLALEGYVVTGDLDAADVAVVNTCAFIDQARQESGEVIEELLHRKRNGRLQMVIVAGCYPQLDHEEVLDNWPDVDAVVGVAGRDELGRVLRNLVAQASDAPLALVPKMSSASADDHERLRLTPRHFAYLRISEGCDNRCSYCRIPAIRGALKSKPLTAILSEAAELLDDGAKELILIGQDTSAYGRDVGDATCIADVLRSVDALPGLLWLRLLYTHPASFDERLLGAYAECRHLLPYVDLPLQHIAQPILDSMGRRTTRESVTKLIAELRRVRPETILRTSLIVGYPGETESLFAELLDFVKETRFDRLGAFTYSPEEGTTAARLSSQVPAEVKAERLAMLMELQAGISEESHRRLIRSTVDVLIDHGNNDARHPAVGRIWGQAPDVDGVTHVRSKTPLHAGELVRAKITLAGPYDLEAKVAVQ
jgi:ribosomal protein S12 methylthiotransferase